MKAKQRTHCKAFELVSFSKGVMKRVVVSALIVLMPTAVQAATYYVSTSGNDSNSGLTEASPWKTVAKVSSSNFLPGDFILFKRGDTWLNDQILTPRSGSATARITYSAYGTGNKPIIRKHASISGWNVASNWVQEGNAWYMANSSDIGRLWLSGVEVMRKQALPVSAANKYFSGNGRLYIYSATNPALTFNNISSVGSIYIVHANSVNYVTLSNLDLQGGSNAVIRMVGSSNWIIDSCNIGLDTTGNGIAANAASATVPSNNTIVRNSRFVTGSKGVWGWEAKYNGDGILLSFGTNGWDMYNNHFENWGHNSIGLINMNGSSYTSKNNKFHHNYCTAPDIDYGRGWGWSSSYLTDTGNEISDNVFYNMGAMSQINGPNIKVHRNIFNKVRSIPYRLTVAQGLNFDGYSSGIPKNNVITNNVFAFTDNAGILFGYGASLATAVQGNVIRNNIIYECDRFYNYAIRVTDSPNNLDNIWQNNLAYKAGISDVFVYKTRRGTAAEFNALNGIDGNTISGNLFADPLFVNAAAGDFHLRAGSPAINAGFSSSPLDPDGTRADIGVFPYTGTVSPSPTPTATVAPSPTPSPTVSPKPSPTPSPTATVAPAPSPTPSPTPTADTTRPVVSAFSIPSTSTSLTVSVTTFTGTDNVRVTGYRITESTLPPLASATGWSSSAPTSYVFASTGTKTLFAWVRDAAGNVSVYKSATVNVGKKYRNRR